MCNKIMCETLGYYHQFYLGQGRMVQKYREKRITKTN